ncbi:c-type cytochrome [Microtetraspora niveoalba]|uniref:c-type cytochrome n=1 Tax=Microtetraspora niveoalba TaxID=46175 RepID=UPI000830D597|nr:c-type cytochrome [Microtetraspora niveoalba]
MRRPGGAAGRRLVVAAALAVLAVCAAACGVGGEPPPEVPGGSPAKGRLLLSRYGCSSCHTVPGVEGADALVGPPLTAFGRRGYIAGQLPNSGPNLQRWIRKPSAVEPGTAMPDLGVTEQDARDIAAYLFTLD